MFGSIVTDSNLRTEDWKYFYIAIESKNQICVFSFSLHVVSHLPTGKDICWSEFKWFSFRVSCPVTESNAVNVIVLSALWRPLWTQLKHTPTLHPPYLHPTANKYDWLMVKTLFSVLQLIYWFTLSAKTFLTFIFILFSSF